MAKIRMGLVGCGGIVQSTHVEGYMPNKDIVEVTAVCDLNPERLQQSKEVFGDHIKCYTDYRDMVDDVDAVSIALPHDLHFEVGMFFAENKKHILMEKPVCNTEEECIRLIEKCEENNLTLMCEYPVRFEEGVVKLKEFMDSGKYGKPYHVSVWTEQFTDGRYTPWVFSSRLGGGQLFSHGCHYIDMLLWFLGDPEYGTHVGTNFGTPWMLKEGTSTVAMKFKSGATAMHFGTWGAKGSKMNYDFQVFMDSGVMLNFDKKERCIKCYYNEDFLHIETTYQADDEKTYEVLYNCEKEFKKELKWVINEFVECINTGREPITSGRKALESLRAIWRMYDAEQHHTVADLSDLVGYDNK